jgi:surfeit locus 1 family protein
VLALGALLVFAGFLALGSWQVHRRAWKLDLIARVDRRVHAPPVAAPGPDAWPHITAANDEYRHVRLVGTFLNDRETLVQASTVLGSGFWVLTPLRAADGAVVLVNRGFVPPQRANPAARGAPEPQGEEVVTGLLRITEPGGGFLRRNDPSHNRWYSRDVRAIAVARGLAEVAPYFVDEDAAPARPGERPAREPGRWPVGGLTVISFYNHHLLYAITWYGLALMVAGAAWRVAREERMLSRRARERQMADGGADGQRC